MKVGLICISVGFALLAVVIGIIGFSMADMGYRMNQAEKNILSVAGMMTQMQQNMTDTQSQSKAIVSSVTVLQQQVQEIKSQPPQVVQVNSQQGYDYDYLVYEVNRLKNQDYCRVLPVPQMPPPCTPAKPAWQGYYGSNPPNWQPPKLPLQWWPTPQSPPNIDLPPQSPKPRHSNPIFHNRRTIERHQFR